MTQDFHATRDEHMARVRDALAALAPEERAALRHDEDLRRRVIGEILGSPEPEFVHLTGAHLLQHVMGNPDSQVKRSVLAGFDPQQIDARVLSGVTHGYVPGS